LAAARRVASTTPRLLPSWPPRAEAVVFDSSRGSTRVSRPVAQTESDSSDIRGGWGVVRLVRLVRLCRTVGLCQTKMSRAARNSSDPRRRSKLPPTPRLVSSDSVGRRCHGRRDSSDSPSRSKVPPTPRLVDSSCVFFIWGSPCDRIRAAYPLGKFDESDAAPFKCVSGRRLSDDPERYAPAKCAPDHPTSGSRRSSKKRGCNPSIRCITALVGRRSCHRRMMACMVRV
jgi:hypothetical protein